MAAGSQLLSLEQLPSLKTTKMISGGEVAETQLLFLPTPDKTRNKAQSQECSPYYQEGWGYHFPAPAILYYQFLSPHILDTH